MSDGDQVNVKPEGGDSTISVVVKDSHGGVVNFKVKPSTKFEKIYKAYANKKGLDASAVRFIFDGQRIGTEDTPASLNLEEGDVLDFQIEQVGGGSDDEDVKPKVENSDTFSLVVQDQQGGEVTFKVKKSTRFAKIFDAFAKKKGLDVTSIKFLFDGNRVVGEDTPASLDMEEGDKVDCVIEQIGGGDADEDDNILSLLVKDQHGGEVAFRVKKTVKFEKLFKHYAVKKGIDVDEVRFLFDGKHLHKAFGETTRLKASVWTTEM